MQQGVHIVKFRHGIAVLTQVFKIQRDRRRPAFGVAVNGLGLLSGQIQSQLFAVFHNISAAEEKIPGRKAVNAGGIFKYRPQLTKILRDENNMQAILGPVRQRPQQGQRPVVADELKVIQNQIAGCGYLKIGQNIRSLTHIAAVQKPQFAQRCPGLAVQLSNLPDKPVQTDILKKAYSGKPVHLFGGDISYCPSDRGGLAVSRRRLYHHQSAIEKVRELL